jgi:pyruvate/2-oxoglutarate/acetoin dehydrogenase E1 component
MTATVSSTRKLTVAKAIQEAIASEMERDPSIFVLGEDIGLFGGVWDETTGLLERFGGERILDTPISETAFVGAGVGAAVEGMRPIVDLMFIDFFGVCMDQIYNHMAKIHLLSGGEIKIPMVLMAGVGGGYGDGAQHSQCLWGTFAHLPGMKVVVPSSAADAKGMMIAAIRDDNPVVYLFHKGIMGLSWISKTRRSLGPVPRESYETELGKANVVREGKDVSLVTLSLSVHHALDVSDELAKEGIDCEVVDLRSLVPLDTETIVESVSKTGRLIVVDEDYESFGVSGEVIARVTERDPRIFKVPPARVCVPDVSLPYARPLEMAVLPTPERIRAAVVEMMRK